MRAMLGLGLLLLARRTGTGPGRSARRLAVVWATDTGAFFAGRAIGGPKLWPAVSPKKTWAGAIGGLVAGIVAGLAMRGAGAGASRAGAGAVSAGLSLAGQAGDLFESAVKRRFGAKDSGMIVPGHGGMMDRVDGLVFAAVAALSSVCCMAGRGNLAGGLLAW